jgi:probable rRNA maturation factor
MSEFVVQIQSPGWQAEVSDFKALVGAALGAVAARQAWPDKEVCVVFSSDEEVRKLNLAYRDQDKPTNVLSFPADQTQADLLDEDLLPLGDVVLALETVLREAQHQQKDFADHVSHLLVHGVLHLLGFDHMEEQHAQTMEALEAEILAEIGISNPYEELAS